MSMTLKQRREVTRIVLDGIKVLSGEIPYGTFSNAPVAFSDEKPPERPAYIETRILPNVRVAKTAGGLAVSSPFNSDFVKSAKALGGKFRANYGYSITALNPTLSRCSTRFTEVTGKAKVSLSGCALSGRIVNFPVHRPLKLWGALLPAPSVAIVGQNSVIV